MISRIFDPEKDKEQGYRIWRDVGWLDKGKESIMDTFLASCHVLVADIDNRAESLVNSTPGTIRYLEENLSMSAVCGVTTSYVGRKRGLAGKLTAELIALDVADGAEISALGMFDQGYYDKLGFGSGSYDHWMIFDPASLKTDRKPHTPVRLTAEEYEAVHISRKNRMMSHGSAVLLRSGITKAEMEWGKNAFGLGYYDNSGKELTHHFWCGHNEGENGPYNVSWMCYQNYSQFLELLALIKGLGDQVHSIRITEPFAIQIQDLIELPVKQKSMTKGSKMESRVASGSYWQIRICNLQKCLEKTHLPWGEVRFNLRLSDPIRKYLDSDAPWHGVEGEYIVTLGTGSFIENGVDHSLPVLEASVNAFTRMWMGIRPASGLAVTDNIRGPERLLRELDLLLSLPSPGLDWEF